MFPEDTSNWTAFVDANRDVLTVIADTLPVQLQLMQTSYVDALVGQLPYGMGFQSVKTLLKILQAVDNGTSLNETLPMGDTIFGTHQLEVLRIPLELPPLDFDYNHIGNAAIVGYILCGIIILASLLFMGWTWYNRKNKVVRYGQPVFLSMICVGALLMGLAIIPLSIDDEKSQRAADIACMCSPWLINIGFTIAFSALFSKTWRLNQILLSKHAFRRVKVTEKDVSATSAGMSSRTCHYFLPYNCCNIYTTGHVAVGCSLDTKYHYTHLLDNNCPSKVRTNPGSWH